MAKKKKKSSYCAVGPAAPGTATGAGDCRITKTGSIKCKPRTGIAQMLRHSLAARKREVRHAKRIRKALVKGRRSTRAKKGFIAKAFEALGITGYTSGGGGSAELPV